MMRSLAVALPLIVAAGAFSVPPAGVPIIAPSSVPRDLILLPRLLRTRLRASDAVVDYGGGEGEDEEDDDDEEAEPGTMRVSEIKAELEIRGVRFLDCFDKESLAARLLEARATGKADPSIIDNFNKQKLEENFSGEKLNISDEDLQKAVGGDGTLPGGMPPDMLQKLMTNPELMALLQSPKMQEAMKLMMTDGQEALEKAMEEDKEVYDILMKLNKVMAETQ